MKKSLLAVSAFACALFFSIDARSQQWGGSTTQTGDISRNGNVSLVRTNYGVTELRIANSYDVAANYTSYWKADGVYNIDGATRLMLVNTAAGTGFTNGLFVGLDQAFGIKSYTIGSKDATPLCFYSSGIERVRIAANGDFSIGNGTNTANLTVAGKVNSREVNVTVNAGADFVFEKDYSLPTLAEVESFIRQNKHLPGIESARKMQTNGVDLGDMNIKLLQKVEELTLYMIDLKKEVDVLKKENATLQAKIK